MYDKKEIINSPKEGELIEHFKSYKELLKGSKVIKKRLVVEEINQNTDKREEDV